MASDTKHNGKVIDKVDGFDVIECTECGFKHVVPIPSEEEVAKFYSAKFYEKEKKNYFKDAEEDLDWWNSTYKNIYGLLSKYTSGKKLLDIGSGPGYFIKCGQKLGWNVLGIEPSIVACEYSSELGVKVIHGEFDSNFVDRNERFDVVVLNLVLEHIPHPKEMLKNIWKVLNPGGIVLITSPNDYNPLQGIVRKTLKFKPWWVVPTHHINYFDFNSIEKFLTSLKFTVVDKLSTFPMEFFLLSGDNYIGNRKLGRASHKRRKLFETNLLSDNPELLTSLYRDMANNNIGREFIIIGRKNGKK